MTLWGTSGAALVADSLPQQILAPFQPLVAAGLGQAWIPPLWAEARKPLSHWGKSY